jgi:hypothetical protein
MKNRIASMLIGIAVVALVAVSVAGGRPDTVPIERPGESDEAACPCGGTVEGCVSDCEGCDCDCDCDSCDCAGEGDCECGTHESDGCHEDASHHGCGGCH